MTDENNTPAFIPVDLSPELQRQSEIEGLKIQRKLDKSWGIKKEEPGPALFELNKRLLEYRTQFKVFSLEFLILQTVEDFNKIVVPLQKKKLDIHKPIAMERKTNKPIIVANGTTFAYKE